MVNELLSITISIHSLRVEGDAAKRTAMPQYPISIHSLRVEGDCDKLRDCPAKSDFNPLPPCGGRPGCLPRQRRHNHFNPLPPCGGRHDGMYELLLSNIFQSTPSVWRETRRRAPAQWAPLYFNPLPPCGGRLIWEPTSARIRLFQSTPSVWRETNIPQKLTKVKIFQSTPSVWRETAKPGGYRCQACISIHSLRVEGDAVV